MGTTLIVANQTIGGTELTAAVQERIEAGDTSFHLLVPMPPSPTTAIAVGLAAIESAASVLVDLPDPKDLAEERLTSGLAWLAELGATASGEVGPCDAVVGATAVVDRGGIDDIIVSTLPSRLSRWLKHDLPTKLGKAVTVPIIVVTAHH